MGSVIGFSTASLKWEIEINEAIDVIQRNGFNAIMLSYPTPLKMMQEIGDRHLSILNDLDYVAIHAPWMKVRYNTQSRMILKRLEFIRKLTNAQHVVFHPDIIDHWKFIKNSGLPVIIENMDKEHTFGTTLDHMKFAKSQGFGLAIDVAHAYTFDRTLKLGRQMLKLNPAHMHVSGNRDGKPHVPLSESQNRNAIIRLVKPFRNVPMIMEMDFYARNDARMKAERSLLKFHDKE